MEIIIDKKTEDTLINLAKNLTFGKDLKKLSRKYRSIKKDYENLLKILSINEPLYRK